MNRKKGKSRGDGRCPTGETGQHPDDWAMSPHLLGAPGFDVECRHAERVLCTDCQRLRRTRVQSRRLHQFQGSPARGRVVPKWASARWCPPPNRVDTPAVAYAGGRRSGGADSKSETHGCQRRRTSLTGLCLSRLEVSGWSQLSHGARFQESLARGSNSAIGPASQPREC